jgi:hypothetical protein
MTPVRPRTAATDGTSVRRRGPLAVASSRERGPIHRDSAPLVSPRRQRRYPEGRSALLRTLPSRVRQRIVTDLAVSVVITEPTQAVAAAVAEHRPGHVNLREVDFDRGAPAAGAGHRA